MQYTPLEDIPRIREALRDGFRSGKTKIVAFRKEQLRQLGYMVQENKQAWLDAFKADLGRPYFEGEIHEFIATVTAIKDTYKSVEKWAKTENAPFDISSFSMHPKIRKEPKGTVLIIVPFNYPLFLSITPLMAAIAAGNTAVLKPSEHAPTCAALLHDLIGKYLDHDVVRVVQGGVEETTKLLELQWDHISYTGNPRVARIVSAAAAKHLTPITLELGGKNPVIIDPRCDLETAARRILWAKCANAGQICVAPDYVLVPREVQGKFIQMLKKIHEEFFPDGPAKSDSLSRIVSAAHTQRLASLIQQTKGEIVFGGDIDMESRYVSPTLVLNPSPGEPLMKEEIFGPILPVLPVNDVDEAIEFINARDHPLVIYVFSDSSDFQATVVDNTQSGAFACNELLFHVAAYGLPLGGTGLSGHGLIRGKFGFDTFSHFRGCVNQAGWLDKVLLWRRYAPYTESNRRFLARATADLFPERERREWSLWSLPVVGTIVTLAAAGALLF
ncbi:NAD-aldehyde dehydrogenase [Cristinia sonorae]|uniref:Aldehyde dehydrogenase n=1 Tax=Cristinia sonorae TaxID=1940300 RepID=A0A8K0UJV3_9AGAR|nr:NAD-aldehyde dehydrogenase [Cristinia sonorae]